MLLKVALCVEPLVTGHDVVVCHVLRFEAAKEDMITLGLVRFELAECLALVATERARVTR